MPSWVYSVSTDVWHTLRGQAQEWRLQLCTPRAHDICPGDTLMFCLAETSAALAVTQVLENGRAPEGAPSARVLVLRPDLVAGDEAGTVCPPLQPYVRAACQPLWNPCMIAPSAAQRTTEHVRAALTHTVRADMALTADDVRRAYKVLLDRLPENEAVVTAKLKVHGTMAALRRDLLMSDEFRERNVDLRALNTFTMVLKELPTGGKLWIDMSDQAIGLPILHGMYEVEETSFVRQTVTRGMSVIDVGANLGYYTIMMADLAGPGGKVHAFEPLPRNCEMLRRSVRENKFQKRIVIHTTAAGARCGMAKLLVPHHTTNWGGAHIVDNARSRAPRHEVMRVRMETLDSCQFTGRIGFIKMDIEGAELLALRGAERLLRRDRPVVMCECNPPQLKNVSHASPQDLVDWMTALKYRVHVLSGSTLMAIDPAALQDRITTVVCTPCEP